MGRKKPAERLSNVFLSWCAGFFDGEGHILIQKRTRAGRVSYIFKIRIGQCVQGPLLRLKDAFGGQIYLHTKPKANWRQTWVWVLTTRNAEHFLRRIQPFLCVKDHEVKIALEFRETFKDENPRWRGVDPRVTSKRKALRNRLMNLPGRRAAVGAKE